jgi:hypothetical protein
MLTELLHGLLAGLFTFVWLTAGWIVVGTRPSRLRSRDYHEPSANT